MAKISPKFDIFYDTSARINGTEKGLSNDYLVKTANDFKFQGKKNLQPNSSEI